MKYIFDEGYNTYHAIESEYTPDQIIDILTKAGDIYKDQDIHIYTLDEFFDRLKFGGYYQSVLEAYREQEIDD